MADRFFTRDALVPGEYLLDGAEAHHIVHVRRFTAGDRITLFNGDGADYSAEILATSKKSVVLHIHARLQLDRELPTRVVIASALPKGDRAEFLIEKLTELGVGQFIPLVTERSIVRPKDATIDKYERAVIEASKQCGRNTLMSVAKAHSWQELIEREDIPGQRLILHPQTESRLLATAEASVILAIGPEGGFTEAEIALAREQKWAVRSLGSRILRVETAAIAAAAVLATR